MQFKIPPELGHFLRGWGWDIVLFPNHDTGENQNCARELLVRSMCGMGREAWLLISGQVNTMAVVTHRSHGCSLYNAGRIFLGSMLAVARIERKKLPGQDRKNETTNVQSLLRSGCLEHLDFYWDSPQWIFKKYIFIRIWMTIAVHLVEILTSETEPTIILPGHTISSRWTPCNTSQEHRENHNMPPMAWR